MCPVTLQTLEDLKTLHQETLFVLLRFYLNVDTEMPTKHISILLGNAEYPIDHSPKNFAEFVAQCVGSIFRAAMPTTARNMFMIQNECGEFFISSHTKKALEGYILKYTPLPKAILYTNEEWQKTETFKNRFGDWSDF
jgi:hypothetical protein